MVSLWPFRGEDNSPASFEKALSSLSVKITKTQLQLDTLRQRSRRLKVLWTLYSTFAYLLCTIILALVVGWRNWGAWEYSAVAGSPLLIYLIREAINTYYTYRINHVSNRLEEQQTTRAKTIDKLKTATKYNSTQQLLEKYGGVAPSPQSSPKPKGKSPARTPRGEQKKQPGRTSIGSPPPTANIPRNNPPSSSPSTPQPQLHQHFPHVYDRPVISASGSPISALAQQPGPPEFAPNAFPAQPQYDHGGEINTGGKWYDRFLDVLLGEDETAPKNRIVLICLTCRLVNGQAPPGVKRLEDLGEWRCMACGAKNGIIDEGRKAVDEMKELVKEEREKQKDEARETPPVCDAEETAHKASSEDPEDEEDYVSPEELTEEIIKDENDSEGESPKLRRRKPRGRGRSKA